MTKIKITGDSLMARQDINTIIGMIPEKSKILDLGCGNGRLLHALATVRSAKVMGVEMNQEKVVECVGRGIPVIQANLDDGLSEFPSGSFDFVILSQTLQAVKNPDLLLDEMLRIGKTGIISFLNIGHIFARMQLFLGNMPVTKTLPQQWYNTTNIHLGTISDFRNLCRSRNIRIVREIPLPNEHARTPFLSTLWPNMFATTCVFIIER